MMSYIEELRDRIDQSLDRWEATAQSLEDCIGSTRETIVESVEQQKAKVSEAADRVKQAVAHVRQLPEDARSKMASDLEHLNVQLALGKADALDAVEDQKRKITTAVRSIEARIDAVDRQIDQGTKEAIEAWIRADIALQQELDLLAMQVTQDKADARTALDAKKQRIQEQVHNFRTRLETKRGQTAAKGEAFATEMTQAFEKVKTAFSNLAE
jgi:hypothetical protein